MKRSWLIAGVIILATAAFAAGWLLRTRTPAPAAAAKVAPAAVERLLTEPLIGLDGKETALSRWRGTPLIVNFWATWCPPCLTEMPAFSRLQNQHKNVQFVGIAVDNADNVRVFAEKNKLSYPLLIASQNTMSLFPALGNTPQGLPFTLGIDAGGQVRQVRLGALSEAETERLITSLQ